MPQLAAGERQTPSAWTPKRFLRFVLLFSGGARLSPSLTGWGTCSYLQMRQLQREILPNYPKKPGAQECLRGGAARCYSKAEGHPRVLSG